MLRDGSPHARDQLRRSRSRSRGRAEWPGGPRDDGPGRLAPSPYAGPPPVRPVHPRERGDWQPPPEAWPGFADPQWPPREWERAELRGERSDPMLGVRRGFGHDEDFSSIHPSRGPPRRAEDVHLPEREGRGRLDHGFEEGKGRSGRDLNEPRSKDVRVPASRRVGDLRGDVRMPGGKGGFLHAEIVRKGDIDVDLVELNGKIASCSHWEEVVSICESFGDVFNAVNISTALNRLAKLSAASAQSKRLERQELVCEALMRRSLVTIREFRPRSISNLMWSLATLGAEPGPALFEAICQRTVATAGVFGLMDFSNMMWALGKFAIDPGQQLMKAMFRRALAIMDKFERHDISTLMSTLMALKISPPSEIASAISKQASVRAKDFNPQGIASLIWVYGNLDVKIPQILVKAMENRAVATMTGFLPAELSRFLWGFAKMAVHPGPELIQAINERARSTAGDFKSEELATFFWAFSKFGESLSQELSEALLVRSAAVANNFKACDIATFVQAISVLKIQPSPEFTKTLLARALVVASNFTHDNKSEFIAGLEKLGIVCDSALTDALSLIMPKVDDAGGKSMNKSLIKLTNLEDICAMCDKNCSSFDHTNICTALHTLAKVVCGTAGSTSSAKRPPRSSRLDRTCTMLMRRAATIENNFTPRHITMSLLALANLGIEPSTEFSSTVQRQAVSVVKLFKVQEVASFLWSLAMFGIEPNAELVRTFSKVVASTVQALKPQHISNVVWAFATLKMNPSQELSDAILLQALQTAEKFCSEDAAKFVWSLNTLELKPSDQLTEAMSKIIGTHVMESVPWKIKQSQNSNSARQPTDAIDRREGTEVPDCLDLDKRIQQCANAVDVFAACERYGEAFNHINISTAMYRLAKFLGSFSESRMKVGLTYRQEKICKLIFQRAVSIAEQLEPHSISTLVWALASLNMPSQQLESGIDAILKRAVATIKDFKPLDMADFVWGLATLGLPPGAMLSQAISNHALKLMDGFNPQQISKFMWGFAKLRLEMSTDLVKSVARRAVETISEFRPINLSQTMWAFAKLERFPGVELGQAMLKRAKATLDGFLRQTQCSANFLWALDKLGIDPDPQVADVLSGRQKSLTNPPIVSHQDRTSGRPTQHRSRSRSTERSSRSGRAGEDLTKTSNFRQLEHPRKWVKVEGERDHSSSKHDVDYKRKRDSESGSRQSDDTVYRPAKRLSGIEISQRTAGRFEGRDLRPLLDSGSQGKEPRRDDTGPPIRGINRDSIPQRDNTLSTRELNSRISACNLPEDIFLICETYGDMFNDVNISTAIHRIAKFAERNSNGPAGSKFQGHRQESLCRAMIAHSTLQMRSFQPQSISNLVWSLATLDMDPGIEFVNALTQQVIATAVSYTPQNIANFIWAFAKVGIRLPLELLDTLFKVAVSKAADFRPQHIGNLMWALATLGVQPSLELVSAISRRTVALAAEFDPQDISNLMWALAMLGFEPGEVVCTAIARRALATIHGFNQQSLSDLIWAFAKLEIDFGVDLTREILARAAMISQTFTAQSIATFMYALATLKISPGPALVSSILNRAAATAIQFNAHGVATLMWALASLRIDPGEELAAAIVRQALATSLHFKSHEVASFMWSLAILRILPGSELVGAMLRRTLATVKDFESLDVSNLLWALASLEIDPGAEIVRAMSSRATVLVGQFKPQEISKLMWALDRLGIYKKNDPVANAPLAMAGHASQAAGNARPQDMNDMMWSLLKLGMETGAQLAAHKIQPGSELAGEILRRNVVSAKDLMPQDLAKMRPAGPLGLHAGAERSHLAEPQHRPAMNLLPTPPHPQGLYCTVQSLVFGILSILGILYPLTREKRVTNRLQIPVSVCTSLHETINPNNLFTFPIRTWSGNSNCSFSPSSPSPRSHKPSQNDKSITSNFLVGNPRKLDISIINFVTFQLCPISDQRLSSYHYPRVFSQHSTTTVTVEKILKAPSTSSYARCLT